MSRQDPRATCATCAWWAAPTRTCRRFAPTQHKVRVMSGEAIAVWPETTDTDWCGEHSYALQAAA